MPSRGGIPNGCLGTRRQGRQPAPLRRGSAFQTSEAARPSLRLFETQAVSALCCKGSTGLNRSPSSSGPPPSPSLCTPSLRCTQPAAGGRAGKSEPGGWASGSHTSHSCSFSQKHISLLAASACRSRPPRPPTPRRLSESGPQVRLLGDCFHLGELPCS